MATATTQPSTSLVDIASGYGNTTMDAFGSLEENCQQCEQDCPPKRPLNLLDLPVDILRLIVKEV